MQEMRILLTYFISIWLLIVGSVMAPIALFRQGPPEAMPEFKFGRPPQMISVGELRGTVVVFSAD